MTNSYIKRAGQRFGAALQTIKSTFAPLLCAAAAFTAQAGHDNRFPDLPPLCDQIAAPADNKVVFQAMKALHIDARPLAAAFHDGIALVIACLGAIWLLSAGGIVSKPCSLLFMAENRVP